MPGPYWESKRLLSTWSSAWLVGSAWKSERSGPNGERYPGGVGTFESSGATRPASGGGLTEAWMVTSLAPRVNMHPCWNGAPISWPAHGPFT